MNRRQCTHSTRHEDNWVRKSSCRTHTSHKIHSTTSFNISSSSEGNLDSAMIADFNVRHAGPNFNHNSRSLMSTHKILFRSKWPITYSQYTTLYFGICTLPSVKISVANPREFDVNQHFIMSDFRHRNLLVLQRIIILCKHNTELFFSCCHL
jgi:hypothetical protein